MMKYMTAAAVATLAMSAISVPAFAAQITDDASCQLEGGTMVNVKNSDYCLVPIRDAEYADAIYDGNQLGVVDCPGNKLNDGKYCMYPVTIRPAPVATTLDAPAVEMMDAPVTDVMNAPAADMIEVPAVELTGAQKRAAKRAAKKAAKDAAKAVK